MLKDFGHIMRFDKFGFLYNDLVVLNHDYGGEYSFDISGDTGEDFEINKFKVAKYGRIVFCTIDLHCTSTDHFEKSKTINIKWPSDLVPEPLFSIGSICGYNQMYSFHGFLYSNEETTTRIEIRITEEIYTTNFIFSFVYISKE